jgi:hypothetical protein
MDQPPPLPGIAVPPNPKGPRMSLLARLLNVFAIPGHVFAEVKATRRSIANWLVPVVIASMVASLVAMALYSQPSFLEQIRTVKAQELNQKVKSGQMTKQQADETQAMLDKLLTPSVLKTVGLLGSVVGSFVSVFGWGLVIWFLGRKYLLARFAYMKAVEVTGLATMISVLGMVVKLLLVVNVGKMFSTQSLGLAVSDFNPDDPNYLLLILINVFQFWFVALLASGLARLANAPFPRAMFLVLICWMLWATFLVIIGFGALVL